MLLPIRHENMSARRWPVVTLALIAINVVVFLFTHYSIEDESQQGATVKAHILILAAMHPELNIPENAQVMVQKFHDQNPTGWKSIHELQAPVYDAWDARMRMMDSAVNLQDEMDSLGRQLAEIKTTSLLDSYAFNPSQPTLVSYITANFLHGGWLHLIGNMWFLWLAGFVLEDTWGRPLYVIFYFVGGAVAMQVHAWMNPGSTIPALGASGAVAALMGAFLVRFPKMKIEMRWILGIRSLARGGYHFSAPAFALLPLWLLTELFYGSLSGQAGGVAHWAHVGGFVFGAAIALLLQFSGLEHKANQAIEKKTTWSAEAEITQATDLMEKGQLDEAAAVLQKLLVSKPESVDGLNLLQQIYWRKGDVAQYQEITTRLCSAYLKARQPELAWQHYEEFLNTGGGPMPAATWFELCRAAESQQNYDRALKEYEKLINAYPTDRPALMAQLAAARIYLKQLNRPNEALQYYQAAASSPIPHLDLETTIEAAVRECKKSVAASVAVPS
jgi:membrane associated rhomboid family serine protease